MSVSIQPPKRRGLKPGQRHSGQFAKGYDPRRPSAERYAQNKSLMELARQDVPTALEVVRQVLADDKASPKEKLTAANIIFDRAHGKPVQGVLVGQEAGTPSTMSTAQLATAAQSLLEQDEVDDDVLEAEFQEITEPGGDTE